MARFIFVAFPWVVTGITIVLAAAHLFGATGERGVFGAAAEAQPGEKSSSATDYAGLCCGVGFSGGVVLGGILGILFGAQAFSYSLCFGTLAGAVVGRLIEKLKK